MELRPKPHQNHVSPTKYKPSHLYFMPRSYKTHQLQPIQSDITCIFTYFIL